MIKHFRNCIGILVAVSATIFASCSSSSDEYLTVIPKDCAAAVKVNVGQLLVKSTLLENKTIKEFAELQTEQSGASISMQRILKNVLDDPNNSGLDINQPVIAVLEGANLKGLITCAVSDKKKLESNIEAIADELRGSRIDLDMEERTDGYTIISVKMSHSSEIMEIAAFDDTKLVVALAQKSFDVMRYLNLSDSEQAVSTDKFMDFISDDDDVVAYFDSNSLVDIMNFMPKRYQQMAGVDYKQFAEMYKDSYTIASLDFENGYAEYQCRIGNASSQLKAAAKKYISNPNGEFLEYIPEDALAVGSVRVNNLAMLIDKSIPANEKNDAIRGLEQLGLTLSDLDAFNGDITFAVLKPQLVGNREEPQFICMANAKNKKVIDVLAKQIESTMDSVVTIAPYVYPCFDNKYIDWSNYNWRQPYIEAGYDNYFGFMDDKVFFMPENIYDDCVKGNKLSHLSNNFTSSPLKNKLDGASLVVDLQAVTKAVEESSAKSGDGMNSQEAAMVAALGELKDFKVVFDIDALSVTAKLTTVNDKENTLKLCIDQLASIVAKEF